MSDTILSRRITFLVAFHVFTNLVLVVGFALSHSEPLFAISLGAMAGQFTALALVGFVFCRIESILAYSVGEIVLTSLFLNGLLLRDATFPAIAPGSVCYLSWTAFVMVVPTQLCLTELGHWFGVFIGKPSTQWHPVRAIRYRLWDLLVVITVVALLFGGLRSIGDFGMALIVLTTMLGTVWIGVLPLLAQWATLCEGYLAVRFVVVLLLAIVGTAAGLSPLLKLDRIDSETTIGIVIAAAAFTVVLLGDCLVIRSAGYRFVGPSTYPPYGMSDGPPSPTGKGSG